MFIKDALSDPPNPKGLHCWKEEKRVSMCNLQKDKYE